MHQPRLIRMPLVIALITALTPSICAQSDYNKLCLSQREFSLELLRTINRVAKSDYDNQNVLVSPYNVYQALLLAYFGARGATEQELRQVLHLQWASDKSQVVIAYRYARQLYSKEFAAGVKAYFDEKLSLPQQVSSIFADELEPIGLHDLREDAQRVNNWISNVTRNEISGFISNYDLIGRGFSLIGAAYYKGRWAEQFDSRATKNKIFYTNITVQSFAAMMSKRSSCNYAVDEDLGGHVLQLPYEKFEKNGSELSMLIILPPFTPNGVENVLSKLTPAALDALLERKMEFTDVDISLPKFQHKLGLNLEVVFRDMGINSIFDDNSDDIGNFFSNTNVRLRNSIHHAKFGIDESGGTDAYKFRSTFHVVKFECNHPFVYLIYDQSAKTILLAGIMRSPNES